MKIVIDVNIWISFGIGKELSTLPKLLVRKDLQIFSCSELTDELEIVCKYPKLKKYLSDKRIDEIFELIARLTITETIKASNANFSDPKDNYLLNLLETVAANYLITGDKRLLTLGSYKQTKIISFKDFQNLLN